MAEAATRLQDARREQGTWQRGRQAAASMPRSRARAGDQPVAIVMGDADLVQTLGLAGVPVALFERHDSSARFSRHVRTKLVWSDAGEQPDAVIATLLAYARSRPEPPVLFPQSDEALQLISRRRDELGSATRFVVPDAELVEQLVDKSRFQALAECHGLPIPRSYRFRPTHDDDPRALDLPFPLVVKPILRRTAWERVAGGCKAFHAGDREDLAAMWSRLVDVDSVMVAQEVVAGPESNIESFHAYVDAEGQIAGSFTGRKIRTYPERYGHSTAVEVVDLPEVRELGCHVLATLGFRGVVKIDFKRDERGELRLLEINPRFNLWHLPAAIAGVNLPALVYADLTGRPRPSADPVRSGVAWCRPLRDVRAAYATGTSPLAWLRWARTCDAKSGLTGGDRRPFLFGTLPATVVHQAARVLAAPFRRGRRPTP
jgi:D-aspartate ligase